MLNDDIIRQKIDEVRPRFVKMLASRLNRFETIRDSLETPGPHPELLDELRFGAHRIAGLAATLGFKDLGDLAHRAENLILQVTESGFRDLSKPEFLGAIDDLLGEMALVVT